MAATKTATPETLEINGIQSLRLLSAFQALEVSSGFYRVSHKQARDIIEGIVGIRPVRGRSPRDAGCRDLQAYIFWLVDSRS